MGHLGAAVAAPRVYGRMPPGSTADRAGIAVVLVSTRPPIAARAPSGLFRAAVAAGVACAIGAGPLVVGAARAGGPGGAAAGPGEAAGLVAVGDTVGSGAVSGVVARVEVHPEFHRYWVRFEGGAVVPVELTTRAEGHEGVCDGGSVTLYPRGDLAQGEPPAGYVTAFSTLCGPLAAHPPRLRERVGVKGAPPEGEPGARLPTEGFTAGEAPPTGVLGRLLPFGRGDATALPPGDRPLVWTRWHLVAAAFLVGLGVALAGPGRRAWIALPARERWEPVVVLLVAAAARALWAPAYLFNGAGAAWEKVRFAWGVLDGDPYGGGLPALLGPVLALGGRTPAALCAADRVIATLGPVALWALVRLAPGARPGAALAAGLALALLPGHVGVSATEVMHVPALTVGLVAMAAAAGWGSRSGAPSLAVVAVAGAGLTAAIRPDVMPFALLTLLFLVPARREPGAATGPSLRARLLVGAGIVALVALAATAIALPSGSGGGAALLGWDAWKEPRFWLTVSTPRWGEVQRERGFSVFWHGGLTPVGLWPLVLVGAWVLPRPWRWRLGVWWLLVEVPVLTKVYPVADAWRLQLLAQPLWLVVVGFGAAAVGQAAARRPALGAAVVALGLGVRGFLVPAAPGWVTHRASSFLVDHGGELPPGRVWIASGHHRVEAMVHVASTLGAPVWAAWDQRFPGATSGPEWVWFGVECLLPDSVDRCAAVWSACELTPYRTTRLGPPTDFDLTLPPDGVEVGWWSLGSCRDADYGAAP